MDLSLTSAGVAVITAPFEASYYTFGYSLNNKSSHRDHLERVIFVCNNIMRVLKKHQVRHVGVENYGFASKGRLSMQADLGGTVKSQLYISGIMPVILSALMIRKYIIGSASKTKAGKKEVSDSLVAMGYKQPDNFDESDALAVSHVVWEWANLRSAIEGKYKLSVMGNIDKNMRGRSL